jgi:hypothetical protein
LRLEIGEETRLPISSRIFGFHSELAGWLPATLQSLAIGFGPPRRFFESLETPNLERLLVDATDFSNLRNLVCENGALAHLRHLSIGHIAKGRFHLQVPSLTFITSLSIRVSRHSSRSSLTEIRDFVKQNRGLESLQLATSGLFLGEPELSLLARGLV